MFTILYNTVDADYPDCIGTFRTSDEAIVSDKIIIDFEEVGDN